VVAPAAKSDAKAKPKPNKFEIVVNYGGMERPLEVNLHQTIQAVLEQAMDLFAVNNNRHTLALFTAGNAELTDLTKSLEDSGVNAGDTLFLRQSEVRGG